MAEKISVAQLKARLNKNINDIEAAIALGNAYYDQGEASQSIIYYRLALDIDPTRVGVRTDLGTMYWRNDDVSLAEQAFREAIARDIGFGNAYVNLGLLLHRAKNSVTDARTVWKQFLDANPEHGAVGKIRKLLQETAALVH